MEKTNDIDFNLISDYFNLELSDENISLFEKRAEEDPSFAENIRSYLMSVNIVNDIDPNSEENLRKQRWKSILKADRKYKKRIRLRRAVAVAAFLVIAFFTAFHFISKKPDLDKLVENAWHKNVGLDFTLRNTPSDSTTLVLIKALSFYEKKAYNDAIDLLKNYNSSSHNFKDILLLKALLSHKSNNTEIALKTLDSLSLYSPNISKWYKGLIYLDKKDINTAQNYLIIPDNRNDAIKLKE